MMLSRCFIKNSLCFSSAAIVLNIILLTKPLGQVSLFVEPASENVYYVSPSGNDSSPGTESQPWRTIQKACNTLMPGNTVYVKAGQYNEKITVAISGTASGGYIVIRNYENDKVVIDGTGISGENIFYIENKDYIKIIGFEICNNTGVSDGSGIRIDGSGEHIELRNNKIYEIRGSDAMGITVYGTNVSKSISYLIIDGNEIYNCDPAHSEALTLNGNVEQFEVTNNIVHDVNNIGIDFIGGEGTCPDDDKDAARGGVCRGNLVYNARSSYGGGYAAGVYVDGGNTIVLERNTVYNCDVGIEVGCEIKGKVVYDIVVRNNLVFNNDKRGIVFGGYDYPKTGKVVDCKFYNNTCFNNDTLSTGEGEMRIEYAEDCDIRNNIFYSSSQNVLMTTVVGNSNNIVLDYNMWFAKVGADSSIIDWEGTEYDNFTEYRNDTGQDTNSQFDDPRFLSITLTNPDLHLTSGSPAIEAGDPALGSSVVGEYDIDGDARISGARVDIGADEYQGTNPNNTTTVSETTTTSTPDTTTTTEEDDDGICPIEEIYGEDAEETEILRYLRDTFLNQTPEGQELIRLYYEWSPAIVKAMEEDEEFKEEIKGMVDGVLPLIGKEIEQKGGKGSNLPLALSHLQ
jgi:hypothetical protein